MSKKSVGIGSLSLILSIIWVFLCITFKNGVCYGDILFNNIGLKTWSDGNQGLHYTVFYILIFLVSALVIGCKYINDFGARTGKNISMFLIILMIIGTFFSVGI